MARCRRDRGSSVKRSQPPIRDWLGLNFAVRVFKMIPSRPSFDAYIARCMARPAFQRAETIAAG
jgi:hypothetical protein